MPTRPRIDATAVHVLVPWWRVGVMWLFVGGLGLVVMASFVLLATAIRHADTVVPRVAVRTALPANAATGANPATAATPVSPVSPVTPATAVTAVTPTMPAMQARNHSATPPP